MDFVHTHSIWQMISKIKNFFRGWFNLLFGKKTEQARTRIGICLDCHYRKGLLCGACGCVIHAKASDPESECPKKLWIE